MKYAHRNALSCLAASTIAVACGGGGSPASDNSLESPSSAGTGSAVAGELVVKLYSTGDLSALLARYPDVSVTSQFGQRPIYRLATSANVDQLVATLRADPLVKYAEPNYRQQAPESRRRVVWAIGGDAGAYASQWNSAALRLAEAHAISTGAGVTVAVLDTGVDGAHPALAGRVSGGYDYVDDDTSAREEGAVGDLGFGHGTHVASLVAQVAPGASIMPVRVLDKQGEGNIWVLAEGLLHAVDPDTNPNTDDGAKVINLSLNTLSETNLLRDIVRLVTCEDDDNDDDADADSTRCRAFKGAVVVSAAGNSGDTTLHYPGAEDVPGALAVAASTQAGTLATFSTRGDWMKVAAPGELIIGAVPANGYGTWSGTSMAAPMVAGVAALLRAADPGWKPGDVTGKITSDGRNLCGTGIKLVDPAKTLTGASGPSIPCP